MSPPKQQVEILARVLFPPDYLAKPVLNFKPEFIAFKDSYTQLDHFKESVIRRQKRSRITPLSGFLTQLSAVAGHYVSPARLKELSNNDIDFLVITGTIDNLVDPSNSIHLATHLKAQLLVWDKCGHSPIQQMKSEFNNVLQTLCLNAMQKRETGNVCKL